MLTPTARRIWRAWVVLLWLLTRWFLMGCKAGVGAVYDDCRVDDYAYTD